MVTSLQNYTQQAQTLAQAPIPQADQERKRQMEEAWKAYRGDLPKPLQVEKDQPDDNVIANRCAPIVDKGVGFLFGQELKIECDQQAYVDGLWGDDDDKMVLLTDIGTNGAVCRNPFVKIVPAQDEMDYPRIISLDPRNCRIVSDPEDYDLHLAYVIEYPAMTTWQKRQIIARIDPNNDVETIGPDDLEDTWTITNYIRRVQDGANTPWQQVGEPEDWPYPFPPIFTCKNLPNPNESWGIPDLPTEIIDLNKSYNFTRSNTSRIIKYHAHPKTVGKGFKASQMNIAVNEVIVLESPDAELKNLEMQSDLASSRAHAEDIKTDMNEQSRIPGIALGTNEPRGNISGIALKQYYQPILEKTTLKRRSYGKLIRQITRAALVLSNKITVQQYKDYKVNLHWQAVLPTDDLAAAQEALILKQIGVSDDTIMSGLGLDPDEELQKSADEDAKKLDMFSKGQGMPPPGMPPNAQPGQGQPPQSPFIGGH